MSKGTIRDLYANETVVTLRKIHSKWDNTNRKEIVQRQAVRMIKDLKRLNEIR